MVVCWNLLMFAAKPLETGHVAGLVCTTLHLVLTPEIIKLGFGADDDCIQAMSKMKNSAGNRCWALESASRTSFMHLFPLFKEVDTLQAVTPQVHSRCG
ncbi:unnamed protein product [Ceratitis capitata]|uniref:(Mediterranean fruit fly) hypothetical protein n=1 Tax=Ceratitis capitata TaxID=7213 RepID=A0A811UZQ9_CERCA|nr:unnamed protein product [Ceratitis capitata]